MDNLFINDLLPMAPGEYVKIYLYGLMFAEQESSISRAKTATVLQVNEDVVDKAWRYWADRGIVRLEPDTSADSGEGDYAVVFINQIDALFAGGEETSQRSANEQKYEAERGDENASAASEDLRKIFMDLENTMGRTLSKKEMDMVVDALQTYAIPAEVFSYAIKYCAEQEKFNIKYISKVALNWKQEGCANEEDVKNYLDKKGQRWSDYRRIFKELGFKRDLMNADVDMMSRWFDDFGFSIGEILEACRTTAGMREPSLRYVNKVLENKYRDRGGVPEKAGKNKKHTVTRKILNEYLDYIRDREIQEQTSRTEEVLNNIPLMNDIMKMEQDLNSTIFSLDHTDEGRKRRKAARENRRKLENKKKEILSQNGYPEDYLDLHYKCDKCKDTGVTDDGRMCTCIEERMEEAFKWNQERTTTKQ